MAFGGKIAALMWSSSK